MFVLLKQTFHEHMTSYPASQIESTGWLSSQTGCLASPSQQSPRKASAATLWQLVHCETRNKAKEGYCSLLILQRSFVLLDEQRHVFCFFDGRLDTLIYQDKMECNTLCVCVCACQQECPTFLYCDMSFVCYDVGATFTAILGSYCSRAAGWTHLHPHADDTDSCFSARV